MGRAPSRVGVGTGNGSAPALSFPARTIHVCTIVRRYGHLAMVANAAPTPDADAPLLVELALELGFGVRCWNRRARREGRRHRE
jgi:hypothetical protein